MPRSAHLIKTSIGKVHHSSTIIYADYKITSKISADVQCLSNLIKPQYTMAVTKHPQFDTRSTLGEITETIYHMANRKMEISTFSDIIRQHDRIRTYGDYNMSQTHIMPDTYFIIWTVPSNDAFVFSQQWTNEVARYSMREQINFDFIAKRTNMNFQWLDTMSPFTCEFKQQPISYCI